MLMKKIKFTDFDGNEREEDFYFNLTKAEILEWNMSVMGGMDKSITNIIAAQDQVKIMALFKEIITKSYGVKTPDGRGFVKNQEVLDSFTQTNAYSELYMELASNSDAATAFINGIMPQSLLAEVEKARKETSAIEVVK